MHRYAQGDAAPVLEVDVVFDNEPAPEGFVKVADTLVRRESERERGREGERERETHW